MRTFSFDWTTARSKVELVRILKRNGDEFRLCAWPYFLTVEGDKYTPAIFGRGPITESYDGTASSMPFQVAKTEGPPFTTIDVENGHFEGAQLWCWVTDAADPVLKDLVFFGEMFETSEDAVGAAVFDVRSPHATPRQVLVEQYQKSCNVDFGGKKCKMPVLPPDVQRGEVLGLSIDPVTGNTGIYRRFRFTSNGTPDDYKNVFLEITQAGITDPSSTPAFSSTPGDVTVDGTVHFTTRDAWTRCARVEKIVDAFRVKLDRLPDPRAALDTGFRVATATWNEYGADYRPGDLVQPNGGTGRSAILQVSGWARSSGPTTLGIVDKGDYTFFPLNPSGLVNVTGDGFGGFVDLVKDAPPWFVPGRIVMRSGEAAPRSTAVLQFEAASLEVTMLHSLGLIVAPGDWVEIWKDCDKTLGMCTFFKNRLNHRGFSLQAGARAVVAPPLN